MSLNLAYNMESINERPKERINSSNILKRINKELNSILTLKKTIKSRNTKKFKPNDIKALKHALIITIPFGKLIFWKRLDLEEMASILELVAELKKFHSKMPNNRNN